MIIIIFIILTLFTLFEIIKQLIDIKYLIKELKGETNERKDN